MAGAANTTDQNISHFINSKKGNWVYSSFFSIAYAFIVGGLILVLITTFTVSYSSLIGSILGYCAAGVGIAMIGGYIFYTLSIAENQVKFTFGSVIYRLTPFITLLSIIFMSVYIIGTYLERISSGRVTGFYNVFTVLSTIFVSLQVYILFKSSRTKQFREAGIMSNMSISSSYLLSIINLIIVVTLGIALRYYSTDGYKNMISL
jgi:hypothetical protein